jgi:hypothetical protein
MKKFGCFAVVSDGFATHLDGCSVQCEDCKIRYPEPKEMIYVKYYKSDEDWMRNIFTEKPFEVSQEKDAIDFWRLMTNKHRCATAILREKRVKINHLPGDFR